MIVVMVMVMMMVMGMVMGMVMVMGMGILGYPTPPPFVLHHGWDPSGGPRAGTVGPHLHYFYPEFIPPFSITINHPYVQVRHRTSTRGQYLITSSPLQHYH